MSNTWRIVLIAAVALAAVGVWALRPAGPTATPADAAGQASAAAEAPAGPQAPLPTLIELGSTKCVPCAAMAPMLAKLRVEYAGRMRIVSIDVLADPKAGEPYDIYVMPTQVFQGANGAELGRHEGYLSRQGILDKWKSFGLTFAPATQPASGPTDATAPSGLAETNAHPDPTDQSGFAGRVAGIMADVSRAISGRPAVALLAAALWGMLSVLLSPCHIASIPLIVAYIAGQGKMTTRRAAATAGSFASGILTTIAAVGVVTYAAGTLLGNTGPIGNYIAAAVLLLVGLNLVGVVPNPFSAPGNVPVKRKGIAAAALLGLAFGLVLGPCTFAFIVPILLVALRAAASSAVFAVTLMVAYGLGYAAVIVLAGSSAGLVQRYLNWGENSRVPAVLRTLCGLVILAGGLWLIYSAA